MNLRLDLAYDGAPFHGWARQVDVRTVQGDIEEALRTVWRRDVATVGAGRTDAGVHAVGQVMSTPDAPGDCRPDEVLEAVNKMCGPSIVAHSCTEVPDDFHARFSARSRTYVYAVLDRALGDPWLAGTALHRRGAPLDVDLMNEAAGHLVGPNDFRSFGRLPDPDASAERVLYELRCERQGDLVRIRARANAFIHQMVRSLVGTLITVGEGRRRQEDIVGVLAARDRAAAGPVAPPHGLCLVSVEYDEGWSRALAPGVDPTPLPLSALPAASGAERQGSFDRGK